ncbi:hypothetical protein D3C81_1880820 [compost metagenome]
MDMRTYSAAGTGLSEEFSEVIRVLGEGKQASFGSGKSWPIRFSLGTICDVTVTRHDHQSGGGEGSRYFKDAKRRCSSTYRRCLYVQLFKVDVLYDSY